MRFCSAAATAWRALERKRVDDKGRVSQRPEGTFFTLRALFGVSTALAQWSSAQGSAWLVGSVPLGRGAGGSQFESWGRLQE